MHKTRKLRIGESDRLDELASASADLWNRICKWYWRTVDRQDHWLSEGATKRWFAKGHPDFYSQSSQAVVEQFYNALKSWWAGENDPPHNCSKRRNIICWKKEAIRLRDDGVLRLSNGRGNDPILID